MNATKPSKRQLRQVAKTPGGRQMLLEQRTSLIDRIFWAQSNGQPVPREARKMLKILDQALGDAQVAA